MARKFLFFISATFLLVSCSKTDTTKPLAEIISPADADTFLIYDTILFSAVFSDNDELTQYRLEMKNNFTELEDSLPAWKFILVDALSDNQDTVTHELIIPDTIYKGSYFLIVKCADAEGNEAAADTSRIVIQ
ncbi:MAG: hypothetical protein POELPBGB_02634 [Bacteroidia bacterium]|nr:hypothetical protein [Bacteroidia bacterium]